SGEGTVTAPLDGSEDRKAMIGFEGEVGCIDATAPGIDVRNSQFALHDERLQCVQVRIIDDPDDRAGRDADDSRGHGSRYLVSITEDDFLRHVGDVGRGEITGTFLIRGIERGGTSPADEHRGS
ncbi:MAG: hypothetical protein KC729_02485, partial [Candidatus Eisenbacteria bacterium]|nr:hypothetical protein [Candidatus Eisenbacteria bacterium]